MNFLWGILADSKVFEEKLEPRTPGMAPSHRLRRWLHRVLPGESRALPIDLERKIKFVDIGLVGEFGLRQGCSDPFSMLTWLRELELRFQ